MRRLITFPCAGETLVGTLDLPDRQHESGSALLIVSGGNEIRCGAHRGMAALAAHVSGAGFPVLRFDRRGIGDSSGANGGFENSGPDIAAAITVIRDHIGGGGRLLGFGNCDAASALLLHHSHAFDRLLLANPWLIEENDDLPPAAAIRARYVSRLRDPAAWRALIGGRLNLLNIFRGLQKLSRPRSQQDSSLEARIFERLAAHSDVRIILADQDATAIAFADAAARRGYGKPIEKVPTASHSFAQVADQAALTAAVLAALD